MGGEDEHRVTDVSFRVHDTFLRSLRNLSQAPKKSSITNDMQLAGLLPKTSAVAALGVPSENVPSQLRERMAAL